MKNLTEIVDGEDLVTKDYVDMNTSIDYTYDDETYTVTLIAGSLEDADSTEY